MSLKDSNTPQNVSWILTLYATLLMLHGVHVFEEATTGFRLIETFGFWPWLHANLSLFALATIPAWYYLFSRELMRSLLRLYGVIMTLNGIAHVGSALLHGAYDPGSFSGVGLVIIGALLVFRIHPTNRAAQPRDEVGRP